MLKDAKTSIFEDHWEVEHVVYLLNAEFTDMPVNVPKDKLAILRANSVLQVLERELLGLLEREGLPATEYSPALNTMHEAILEALSLVRGNFTRQFKDGLPALELALWKIHATARDSEYFEVEEKRQERRRNLGEAREVWSNMAETWHKPARKVAAEIRSKYPKIATNKTAVARRVRQSLNLQVTLRQITSVI